MFEFELDNPTDFCNSIPPYYPLKIVFCNGSDVM